jgi:hypothetical protein
MKRYLLFAGDQYYPSGGWRDFRGSFATSEEAVKHVADWLRVDWWHVVDGATGALLTRTSNPQR